MTPDAMAVPTRSHDRGPCGAFTVSPESPVDARNSTDKAVAIDGVKLFDREFIRSMLSLMDGGTRVASD